jgi:hypothetical protein
MPPNGFPKMTIYQDVKVATAFLPGTVLPL